MDQEAHPERVHAATAGDQQPLPRALDRQQREAEQAERAVTATGTRLEETSAEPAEAKRASGGGHAAYNPEPRGRALGLPGLSRCAELDLEDSRLEI